MRTLCLGEALVVAGDNLLGVLIAALGRTDYAPGALADALPEAVEAAARATERWGAVA